ncbi:MAG: glycosyltransferase family 4 protein [Muribaculaceae bacterium]|nr:glycosyltransferase family 4 protein [Muribaculaceae bacterium]
MAKRKKICFVVAVPGTARSFLSAHIRNLSKNYDIYVAGNITQNGGLEVEGIKGIFDFDINRDISLKTDLKALYQLTSYFKKMKFDAVQSVTPKAGLITALAAKFGGVKNRIHIFTGQVWATKSGWFRRLLKGMDKLIVALDNYILTDGESQRQFLIKEGVLNDTNSRVLGAGSICGADSERFSPIPGVREEEREKMHIPEDKVVFSFMGRLNRDKGIYELFQAFNNMVLKYPNSYLLFFGNDEGNCLDSLHDYPNIHEGENFQFYGRTTSPQLSLQASDVFCMPSYREGFGMSVVEAQALGLPVICSDAYGLGDTIADNETGLRCKVGDVDSLQKAMEEFYQNPEMRKRMGEKGRERVINLFAGDKILKAWSEFYDNILDRNS